MCCSCVLKGVGRGSKESYCGTVAEAGCRIFLLMAPHRRHTGQPFRALGCDHHSYLRSYCGKQLPLHLHDLGAGSHSIQLLLLSCVAMGSERILVGLKGCSGCFVLACNGSTVHTYFKVILVPQEICVWTVLPLLLDGQASLTGSVMPCGSQLTPEWDPVALLS